MSDTPSALEPHPLIEGLVTHLGDAVLDTHHSEHGAWARLELDAWRQGAEVLRHSLGCAYFAYLSGLDWQPNPLLDGEKTFAATPPVAEPTAIITDPALRMGGGSSRFQVMARVQDVTRHLGITVVADLDDHAPSAPSWTPTYRGADWHEREAWEMFGFDFPGHPGLRKLYLPDAFEGHPMRKDFALVARIVRPWPGLVDMEEMPPVEVIEE